MERKVRVGNLEKTGKVSDYCYIIPTFFLSFISVPWVDTVIGGGKPFRKVGGQVYVLENDELVTEDDPKGDQKIDKDGVLQGGEIACPYVSKVSFHTNAQAVNSRRRHLFFPNVIQPGSIC